MTSLDGLIPGIVDAHMQQRHPRRAKWSLDRRSRAYRLVPAGGDRLFSLAVSQADREALLNRRSVRRPYELRAYNADIAGLPATVGVPVDSVVHVETHWYNETLDIDKVAAHDPDVPPPGVAETEYVTSLPFGRDGNPELVGLVVYADPRWSAFDAVMDRHGELTSKIRGIRWKTAQHPDPKVRRWADKDCSLVSQEFLRGFARVAERELVFDALCYSHQLYEVVTLAREYPEARIVVNHFGLPAGVFGPVGARTGATAAARADILALWRERLGTLAGCENVSIKLSGLAFGPLGYGHESSGNIGSRQILASMMGPLLEFVVNSFGPERVIFGSNFPLDKPNGSMDMVVGAIVDVLGDRGDYVMRRLFRENARDTYRLDL